jgi:hypothetical protein
MANPGSDLTVKDSVPTDVTLGEVVGVGVGIIYGGLFFQGDIGNGGLSHSHLSGIRVSDHEGR